MTTIPRGARVTPLSRKLLDLNGPDIGEAWYRAASRVLRGGDGGEHGLLLYKLILGGDRDDGPLVVLTWVRLGASRR